MMEAAIAVLCFGIALVAIILVLYLEDELTDGFRLEKYGSDAYLKNRIYMAYREHPLAADIIHILMVTGAVALPASLMWISIDQVYAPLTFIILVFVFRRSFRRLDKLVLLREQNRFRQLVSAVHHYVQTWVKRGAGTSDEILKKRIGFLSSTKPGISELTTLEVDNVLRSLGESHDEVGLAAAKLLDMMHSAKQKCIQFRSSHRTQNPLTIRIR